MVTSTDLANRLHDLTTIGLSERGTNRLAWTDEDEQAAAWFHRQAESVGLRPTRDPAGNLWALPPGRGPWWGTGSHLDSVRDGGRFDGALGVAAGFEIAARCDREIAVVSFADEEGARFNTPTFGSRALIGALQPGTLDRRDDDGVTLAHALHSAGVDPTGLPDATTWLDRLLGFVELHIDQTRELDALDAPAGIVSGLASRLRIAVDCRGSADHSGTTRGEERSDALASVARLIVAALDLAAAEHRDLVVTASRILVEPNALTTIPEHVKLWIDARSALAEPLDRWRGELAEMSRSIAAAERVELSLTDAARSDGSEFDSEVCDALRASGLELEPEPMPEVLCFAGHDAGVIGRRRPTGMVFVRNPSGVSHSREEHVELQDAAVAANVVLGALERLAGAGPPGPRP